MLTARDSTAQVSRKQDDRTLVFIHIPKTAGQTLRTAFSWKYPKEELLELNTLDKPLADVGNVPRSRLSRVRVIFGHVHYGIHSYLPRDVDYATFLRDPLKRVISLYAYILRDPIHPLHERILQDKISFEEFILKDLDPLQINNGTTRQIAGVQNGPLSGQHLAVAKENLSRFLVVGTMERFSESLVLLRKALGWRMPAYRTKNVSPPSRSFDITPQATEAMIEKNTLDLALFEYGSGLIDQRILDAGMSLRIEASIHQRLMRLSRRIDGPLEPVAKLVRRAREKSSSL